MARLSSFKSEPVFTGVTSESKVDIGKNNTDVIAPDVRLYIEGVQVPFENISINQSYGSLPSAAIQIPPQSGLLDITKGYEPKVHIFYRDDNFGGYRLLFWGTIKSHTYFRSRGSGNSYIVFQCEHKNSVLQQITMDFSGWASPTNESLVDPNSTQSITKPQSLNSTLMIIKALAGVTGVATEEQRISKDNGNVKDAPIDKLDPDLEAFEKRLIGMPGIVINFWNQIKKGCYENPLTNIALAKMYIPLLEEGLSFFKRMSGHNVLEEQLDSTKQPYCNTKTGQETQILVPPNCRSTIASAVQQELTVKHLQNMIGFSGELSNIWQMINYFYNYSQYEILTLASPAEVHVDPDIVTDDVNISGLPKMAIETIIKPQLPLYFSPVCNVLFPRMYHSVSINQSDSSVPTRVAASHDAMPGQAGARSLDISFKGPPSVREAVAFNAQLNKVQGVNENGLDLQATKSYSYAIPAKYEQGVGIKPQKVAIPWWLSLFIGDKDVQGNTTNQESYPQKGTREYNAMMAMSVEWTNRFGKSITQNDENIQVKANPAKKGLNPHDPLNKSVAPHERIMFSTIDYEFTERVLSSRYGTVDCPFNPYIIPGYPMDLIDESSNHPSFHAFCTSVSHSITSSSISTSVGMTAVVTYAELSNYYMPPTHPFLQTALNIVNSKIDDEKYSAAQAGDPSPFTSVASTLLQNPVGKNTADTFYREVLGVGAVAPDDLIHFASGRQYMVDRKVGVLKPRNSPDGSAPAISGNTHVARQTDDNLSYIGNMRLVGRAIESKESIEQKFGYKFIDLTKELYNTSFVNYVNPKMAKDLYLEPGASLFLDYMETDEFIRDGS